MTTPLGERVLDACLRRLHQSEALRHDLVLVREHVALSDCPPLATLRGDPWRIERVTGELTLRDALPDAGRLVAIVPATFLPPPDIAGRAWLGKAVEVRADDVVSGLTGRQCEPLPDDEVGAAVVASLDHLRQAAGRWSQYGIVTASEVRAVLVAAELGTEERLDRVRDTDLLARWILGRAPSTRTPDLLARALKEAHPRTGAWLAWAARTGDVPGLVAAGALGEHAQSVGLDPAPRNAAEWRELRNLVDLAVREAWKVDAGRTIAALATAEKVAHRAGIPEHDAARFPLVRAVLDRALFAFARRCAAGSPPDDAEVEALRANLHAATVKPAIDQVADLARLARSLAVHAPGDGNWQSWACFARDHAAWVDLAIREVRRRVDTAGGDLREAAETLLRAAFTRRDAWNLAFAETLACTWPSVAASKDVRAPLPLQHVTRSLVARLVDAGNRVFLVVLDGCDLSTFIELARELPDGLGLALPSVSDPVLRGDIEAVGPLNVGVSPLPTVTSHSRRALFASEVAGNTALNETESAIANSAADKQAFAKRGALKDVPRVLLLKGDLADSDTLARTLATATERVVAVVLNGVDDALSSKETTAIPPWNLGVLGGGADAALRVAADAGWTILVTADHGHTPYLSKDRKVAASALGARYHDAPLPGAVRFEGGGLPRSPLYLLTALGAWAGAQHRGFHGGAGLEEVVVPLAFLGRVEGRQGRPRAPTWWWTSETIEIAERPAQSLPPMAASGVPAAVRDALSSQPSWLDAVERLAAAEVLSLSQLCGLLSRPPFIVGGMMSRILAELARAGVAAPFAEEESGGERAYRWKRSEG
ncbi:MAG: BREX-2 system phosphatase PglZ [Myxococcota bacterium]